MKIYLCSVGMAWASVVAAQPAPAGSVIHQATPVAPQEEKALVLDAETKEYTAKPGEESHVFTFAVRNGGKDVLTINQVRSSCGCTVPRLPAQPWRIAPGEGGVIELVVDLRGKSGVLVKTATIDLPTTFKVLTVKVNFPKLEGAAAAQNRAMNLHLATADRQAVFKGDCARCHVEPAVGLHGAALYLAACGICHDAEHRASMVPDLRALNRPTDRDFWRTLTTLGKPGTLMPAFGKEHGGPLAADQIDSLVEYLAGEFSRRQP
jgi:mono/diheme cytochrome c family protein